MTNYNTSHSLLHRALNLDDQDAWEVLFVNYKRFICSLLIKMNVPPDDVDDLVQSVLLTLSKDLKSYNQNKGKFRNWLAAVVRNHALTHFRSKNAKEGHLEKYTREQEIHYERFEQDSFKAYFDQEWEQYILDVAIDRLKETSSETALKVIDLERQELSVKEIADQTGLSIAAVYKMRDRIRKKVIIQAQQVIQELEGTDHSSPPQE